MNLRSSAVYFLVWSSKGWQEKDLCPEGTRNILFLNNQRRESWKEYDWKEYDLCLRGPSGALALVGRSNQRRFPCCFSERFFGSIVRVCKHLVGTNHEYTWRWMGDSDYGATQIDDFRESSPLQHPLLETFPWATTHLVSGVQLTGFIYHLPLALNSMIAFYLTFRPANNEA